MKNYFIVFLLLLAGCNNAQSRQLAKKQLANYPWQFIAPMPHGRYGHAAVYAANGKIYVIGGLVFKVGQGFRKGKGLDGWMIGHYNDGKYSNLAYDPKTDKWEYMTSVPGSISDHVMLYYPDEDRWSEKQGNVRFLTEEEKIKLCQPIDKKKKPTKIYETNLFRQGNGVAITKFKNDSILWLGGQSFVSDIENIILPYNIQNDSWPKAMEKEMDGGSWRKTLYDTEIPPMQEPRRDHRAVTASDGKIYVLGGWRLEKVGVRPDKKTYDKKIEVVSKTMECYDPATNKWEYKKPLRRERMDFAAVVGKDDKIYVFGGAAGMVNESQTPILNTVEVYDSQTDSWSFRKPMPAKLSGHYAVLAADNRIYIMGGAEIFERPISSVYIYDTEKDVWERGPDMILARDILAAAATPDGKIYAIGGTDVGAYENKAQWEHLTEIIPENELGDYTGKVQDTVEVLDIYNWRKSKKAQ
jgi:hypothetical protein